MDPPEESSIEAMTGSQSDDVTPSTTEAQALPLNVAEAESTDTPDAAQPQVSAQPMSETILGGVIRQNVEENSSNMMSQLLKGIFHKYIEDSGFKFRKLSDS